MHSEIFYGTNYPLTWKMVEALKVISNEENDHAPQTLDEVLSKLPYKVTKQAFQFTLRALIKRGLVRKLKRVKRDKKSRRMLQITPIGCHKLVTESWAAELAADAKTCEVDEVEKTNRLLRRISTIFS